MLSQKKMNNFQTPQGGGLGKKKGKEKKIKTKKALVSKKKTTSTTSPVMEKRNSPEQQLSENYNKINPNMNNIIEENNNEINRSSSNEITLSISDELNLEKNINTYQQDMNEDEEIYHIVSPKTKKRRRLPSIIEAPQKNKKIPKPPKPQIKKPHFPTKPSFPKPPKPPKPPFKLPLNEHENQNSDDWVSEFQIYNKSENHLDWVVPSNEDIIRQGYLKILLGVWSKKWCVLHDNKLSLYRDNKTSMEDCLGYITLDDCSIRSNKKKKGIFEIYHPFNKQIFTHNVDQLNDHRDKAVAIGSNLFFNYTKSSIRMKTNSNSHIWIKDFSTAILGIKSRRETNIDGTNMMNKNYLLQNSRDIPHSNSLDSGISFLEESNYDLLSSNCTTRNNNNETNSTDIDEVLSTVEEVDFSDEDEEFETFNEGNTLELKLYGDNVSKEERNALLILKQHLIDYYETEWELYHDHNNDHELLRFLRARNLDIDKSSQMLVNYWEWYAEKSPWEITFSMIEETAYKKICHFHYHDKDGYPTLIVYAERYIAKDRDVDAILEFILYVIYHAINCLKPPNERFSALIDHQGFGRKNVDMSLASNLIPIFQSYFPERLGNVYLINIGWTFKSLWKVTRNLLDSKTTDKVNFIDKTENLLDFFDRDKLPKYLGGTSEYEHTKDSLGFETIDSNYVLP
eukprot:TRINITY_DN5243_c0_g1_i1.p1 TRINITY_DN5243_c0_g1~~TRINITY_DN5243_c0_g1_i1.p1  ORF type:complete len:780 (+),score=221.01 TRINITY_DN5243_c0_g1_i1:297-2342(+)